MLAKALVGAGVWATGFRAVSDDDFARVVLSQTWAAHPKLDPTGTSWLPLPFWLCGGAMRAFGDTSLAFARGVAFFLGLASAVLVLAAARLLVRDRKAAMLGALLACAFPWSARLGVATVPELPTAALSLFGVATLASSSARLRVGGAAALLAACWSRYEPWPLAAAFVALQFLPLRLTAPVSLRGRSLASLVAAFGPAAWIAHNAMAHGDPLHFLARVSAYKRALGADDPWAMVGYPLALVREEPELWLAAAACAVLLRSRSFRRLRAPALALFAMVFALSLAAARGGAPTHHNGRALLAVWLLLAVYVGAALAEGFTVPGWRRVAVAAVAVLSLPVGALVLRPWYARLDAMSDRTAETRIGARARELAAAGPVLLEVRDFGFFAVQAGSGRPDLFVLDRTLDPRDPGAGSSFRDPEALRLRIAETGARYVLGAAAPTTLAWGEPLAASGLWGLWTVPPQSP